MIALANGALGHTQPTPNNRTPHQRATGITQRQRPTASRSDNMTCYSNPGPRHVAASIESPHSETVSHTVTCADTARIFDQSRSCHCAYIESSRQTPAISFDGIYIHSTHDVSLALSKCAHRQLHIPQKFYTTVFN